MRAVCVKPYLGGRGRPGRGPTNVAALSATAVQAQGGMQAVETAVAGAKETGKRSYNSYVNHSHNKSQQRVAPLSHASEEGGGEHQTRETRQAR